MCVVFVCVRMADSWVCRISKRPCLAAESPASAPVGRGAECEHCEKATAVVACEQCECSFCGACSELIHASKAMKKHKLAPATDIASTHNAASNTPQSMHAEQPQPQPEPAPAMDGFGYALQAVRCDCLCIRIRSDEIMLQG